MAPLWATPVLCQIKYTSVQVSCLWFPGGYYIWPRAPCLISIMAQSLLKSGQLPVDRCGTCQETISRRLEHMYTPSLREGPLYKSVSNKFKGVQTVATIQVISGPLLNSGLRRLFRYGTHQTINGRLELVHLPSDLILEWPGERPLFQLELKKYRGQYVGTIRVIPGAIIYVKSGTLGQVSHQCVNHYPM